MKLTRYSPARDLWNLEDHFNRMFESFLPARMRDDMPVTRWEPAIDVFETDKAYVLKAELPGIEEKDVHVNVEGNILTLTGERKHEEEVKKEHYHRTESFYGTFSRSFVLPDSVDREKIKATFKQGIMKLEMPKKEEVKPKEIKIEVEK
jgi:HSP20 family protein